MADLELGGSALLSVEASLFDNIYKAILVEVMDVCFHPDYGNRYKTS